MKKIILLFCVTISLGQVSPAQNIGIGTTTPNAKAILDIRATDKGILFPALTTVQRNGISSPPNGLHIFNTDDHCLNYYDSVYRIWNCYCDFCQVIIVNITSNTCNMDFFEIYAKFKPAKKYIVNIASGITVSGCNAGDTALSFSSMPVNSQITINNYGIIAGAGGSGGDGTISTGCNLNPFPPIVVPPQKGGDAISTKTGVQITVNNYGILAGGGGGGGVNTNASGYTGGGGGGAGIVSGNGGSGGGIYVSPPNFPICVVSHVAQPGGAGQAAIGGIGGTGANGGLPGGNGGARGQPGINGNIPNTAGAAGRAIGGGSGNSVTNMAGGQSFGAIN